MVRSAIHKPTKTRVAIKALRKEKLSVEELDLAKREIEILKCCQHPNIVRLMDVFENMQHIYIVMEVLTGGDFDIPEERAYKILHSLATALYYLHNYGIIHRDLKLENVMMADTSEDSDVKILDFGLSQLVGPNQRCKEPFGTVGYAAPEILQSKDYDKGIDIWSLGVIAYMLLSGTAPFEADTAAEISLYILLY